MLKSIGILLLFPLALTVSVPAQNVSSTPDYLPTLQLELSVREDGTATQQWASGIAIAIGEEAANEAIGQQIPMSPEAEAWFDAIEAAVPHAESRGADLADFLEIQAFDATVVVGNRASSDGFGWVPNHIGINVEAFAQTYGPPDDGAIDRATRIIAHEYLHLLTYDNYPHHRDLRTTPFDRALWTIFFEGIGDYVSVSSRWLPDKQGDYSVVTAAALERLEPVFVDRLERLADATEADEPALRDRIAMGKFDEKWGSLPFALWLHSEAAVTGEQETLRKVFNLERDGVLALAEKHIGPELRARVRTLRDRVRRRKADQVVF